MNAICTACTVF